MAHLTDAELLGRFRAGDDRALETLFERHETPLYYFLLGMLHDSHQAEDTLQETFVRALERLEDVDPDHLRGWLFTVAYHQAMLHRRKEGVRKKRTLPSGPTLQGAEDACAGAEDPLPGPFDLVQQADDARRVRELLDKLPPLQREVILQRIYDGKKFREIAEAMDCPLNTALARMHEGLKRLRLLWGESHV